MHRENEREEGGRKRNFPCPFLELLQKSFAAVPQTLHFKFLGI